MIIPDSFKRAYEKHSNILQKVQNEADGILREISHKFVGVGYSSRLKAIESVFIKTVASDFENPFIEMDDFFACTLVVPTLTIIPQIREEVQESFTIVGSNADKKQLDPYQFMYNDLHLYLSLQDSPLRYDKTTLNLKFELQIKTLLQHAWSQAGHDIIYKPRKIDWGSERIGGQLRALLELADSVLAQIEATAQLLQSDSEDMLSKYKSDTRAIISIMEKYWTDSQLPRERRRLAQIIQKYLDIAGIRPAELEGILENAKQSDSEIFKFVSLPPFQQVFILLFYQYKQKFINKLNSDKYHILITEEMVDIVPDLGKFSGKVKL